VALVPGSFVHQGKIETAVERAATALAPEVVRIRYSFGEDWSGAGAVFFRVVLTDSASRRNHLREIAKRVSTTLFSEVKPDELGLQVYFNFRSASEQAKLQEPTWA
jgi:hypothetical protein